MGKARSILVVIAVISILYLIISVFASFLADITVSVNQQLDASTNMSQYEGTSGFLLASPWVLYTAPAVIGIILIIIILRRQDV